ncbi:pinopsin-like [Oncorhynchus tshawytscha]|uniref:G-protein coupled receptors family 1 profile domain-containing protein n=1 Tax=Oncorhynchus tshawytscha TaxID=74940 RepID=A0A8C8DF77_ONCTS|nr:pinopsin-like [Oncorhynchus tshawytscha]
MSHPPPLTPQGATIVVESRNFNFSTQDSSATNPNASDSVRDSLVYSEKSELSRTGHTVVAVFLGVILLLGFISNFFVLLLFARFQVLRTPINLILLNISVSDMLVCIFGTPFSFAASLYGRWLIGDQGCKWYGFANTLFGIVSLVSLAVLSYERYSTILSYTKADPSDYKKAWLAIAGAWLYSLVWTMPPFFGWSSYGPEGPGTICSVQWHQRSSGNISYVTCLFIFCLLLPLLLMVICYGKILFFIRGVAKTNQLSAHRRETHVLVMVVSMVSCYLLCWMPYGVVALLATFGQVGLVGPTTSIVPSILAKSSTFLNPIIYILLNNQFYRCFLAFMSCGSEPTGSHTLCTLPSSRVTGPNGNSPCPRGAWYIPWYMQAPGQ